jgi:hypothetical protein
VKCAFGLLKKRFNILAPDQSYSQGTLGLIMRSCIILHNMIIYDECEGYFNENYHTITFVIAPLINYEAPTCLTSILRREAELISGLMFSHLQSDLIEYV